MTCTFYDRFGDAVLTIERLKQHPFFDMLGFGFTRNYLRFRLYGNRYILSFVKEFCRL